MRRFRNALLIGGVATSLAACDEAFPSEEAGYGPNPILPELKVPGFRR